MSSGVVANRAARPEQRHVRLARTPRRDSPGTTRGVLHAAGSGPVRRSADRAPRVSPRRRAQRFLIVSHTTLDHTPTTPGRRDPPCDERTIHPSVPSLIATPGSISPVSEWSGPRSVRSSPAWQTFRMADHTVPSETELRERLTPLQFEVTQHGGTERAFSGVYWDEHGDGIYHCVVCDAPLFSSDTKFESGSGWPSFWQAIDPERVTVHEDRRTAWSARRHCRELWCAPRARVPRRPGTDGRPLLHELGVAQPEARRRRFADVVDPRRRPAGGVRGRAPRPTGRAHPGHPRDAEPVGRRFGQGARGARVPRPRHHECRIRRIARPPRPAHHPRGADRPRRRPHLGRRRALQRRRRGLLRRRRRRRDRDGDAARRHRCRRLLDRGLRPARRRDPSRSRSPPNAWPRPARRRPTSC